MTEIITRRNSNELINNCKNLPSDNLKKYCIVNELINRWLAHKASNNFYGYVLNAALIHKGNPAREAFLEGYIDKWEYEVYLSKSAMDTALLTVFRLAWREIKIGLKNFKNPPKTEFKLFLCWINRYANASFVNVLEKSKKHTQKLCSVIISENSYSKNHKILNSPSYNEKDTEFFESISPNLDEYFYDDDFASIAYLIALETAKTDAPIRNAIQQFNSCSVVLARLLLEKVQ